MPASFDLAQHIVSSTIFRTIAPQNTVPSGECGLKNLGQGLANITNAIDGLRNQKPALVLQLKKSGKSQQARKTYKLTVAGIKAVEVMIDG
jgi:hypothetical protein